MALPKSGNKDDKILDLNDLRKQRIKKRASQQQINAKQEATNAPAPETPCRRKGDKNKQANSEQVPPSEFETPLKRSRVSNRRFDKVKVERIKSEIANGEYRINYLHVADKFIEHERYT